MAHPKRKTSKTRRDTRRAHIKVAVPTLMKCQNCSSAVQYHRVCPACGYYKGKLAIEKAVAV
ncbi:MAG: 50S ribosomal protein L32 [Bacteroidales bacterium]|nr:50S ribosomal protein L32 [Bacteroidales bacterium]